MPGYTHDFTDASRGPRLQKILAEAGVASRRACEELIISGGVTVNGHVVKTLPAWADPRRDRITVEGRPIRRASEPIYVMLNKPRGVVCTNDDPEGRTRAIDIVEGAVKERLFPVGRLDQDSTGLLVLTNDGDFANLLTHPRYGVHKIYEVTVKGSLDGEAVQKLERGLFLPNRRQGSGSRTVKSKLALVKRDTDRTRLRMELCEGRNRQIRRMMAQLGYSVKRLRRIQMGPLKLHGLKPGQWRPLATKEISMLKRAADRKSR